MAAVARPRDALDGAYREGCARLLKVREPHGRLKQRAAWDAYVARVRVCVREENPKLRARSTTRWTRPGWRVLNLARVIRRDVI